MRFQLLLAVLFVLSIIVGAGAQTTQPAVLTNGDFELLDDSGRPVGWDLPGGGNTEVATEGGNRFVIIRPASNSHLKRISKPLKLEPTWKTITVSARLRVEGLEIGAQSWQTCSVILQVNDAAGKKLTYGPPIRVQADTNGWTTLQSTFDLPPDAATLLIEPGVYGPAGLLAVDDITVRVDAMRVAKVEPKLPRTGVSGASIDEAKATVTLSATPDDPASLKEAIKTANQNKAKGIGTRILMAPGLYRQSIAITGGADNEAPIIVEAARPGEVVLSGADVWSQWQAGEKAGTWTRAWPHKWGVAGNPWEKEYKINIQPIVRRRELVAMDGQVLKQVLEADQLIAGSYCVDESAQRITLMPPDGTDPNQAQVEVGLRERVIEIRNTSNVLLRGVIVQHAATPFTGGAIVLSKVRNVLLDNVDSRWNNARGVALHDLYDLSFRNCRFNDNGANGVGGARIDNLLYEDVDTSRNNWRGAWGKWHGWDLGGSKLLFVHNAVFRRYTAIENHCPGLWLDWDNENLLIEDSRFERNTHTGLGYEASKGPIVLRNVTISQNGQSGLHIHSGSNGTVDGCRIVGNASQISVYRDGRPVKNWQDPSQPPWTAAVADWRILNSVIASESRPAWQKQQVESIPEWFGLRGERGLEQPLFHPTAPMHFKTFVDTLRSDNNVFFHPSSSEPMLGVDGQTRLSLAGWTKATGQDANSRPAPPDQASIEPIAVSDLPPSRRELIAEGKLIDAQAGPFPLARSAAPERWHRLDLAGIVNRPLTGKDAWIGAGMDVPELLVPKLEVAAVPFQLVKPAASDAPAVVALRSAKLQSTRGQDLPRQVEMPVDRAVKAMYFLHGAGYIAKHGPIARYEVVFEDGSTAAVDVVAFGPAGGEAPAEQRRRISNVQDWWPTHPTLENEDVRRAPIPGRDQSVYVLQWINPNPAKRVLTLRLRSTGDDVQAAFLLLGVTVLEATAADIESL